MLLTAINIWLSLVPVLSKAAISPFTNNSLPKFSVVPIPTLLVKVVVKALLVPNCTTSSKLEALFFLAKLL